MNMKKTAAILAAMAVITAAAFSCGKEEADTEKPELPELPGVTTSAEEDSTETVTTEAATSEKTEKPTEKATEATEPGTESATEPAVSRPLTTLILPRIAKTAEVIC